MIKANFNNFNIALSNTKRSSDSEECWREFLVVLSALSNYCSFNVKEDEMAEIIKSLSNWMTKRHTPNFTEKDAHGRFQNYDPQVGEIYLADLGMSYETAYVHPILVLEKIGNKLFVVPCTSTQTKIDTAFHPIDLITGDTNYRKVKITNGFFKECALILNGAMIISKGRLIERKGILNEIINDPNSIFNEVKSNIHKLLFGKKSYEMEKLKEQISTIESENADIKSVNEKLNRELEQLKLQLQTK